MKNFLRMVFAILTVGFICFNIWIELKPNFIVGPEKKLFMALIFAVLLALTFFIGGTKADKAKRMHDFVMILFWYYIWLLANVLFFDSTFGRGFSFEISFDAVNLQPLKTIRDYISAYHYGNISLRLVVLNLIGNLAAFAPMGFFLPALFRWQRSIFFFAATLTLSITAIEVLQVYSGAGSCDIDDLILNLAGALIVFVLCRFPPLWRKICRITPKKEKEYV